MEIYVLILSLQVGTLTNHFLPFTIWTMNGSDVTSAGVTTGMIVGVAVCPEVELSSHAVPLLPITEGSGSASLSPHGGAHSDLPSGRGKYSTDLASCSNSSGARGYAELFRDEAGFKSKGRPAPIVTFDIAKPSDQAVLEMIQLYDDGADRGRILRKLLDLCPGAAEVFPYSVELEVGSFITKVRRLNWSPHFKRPR
uniref:Uncharacterized protein n=1 Tax=Hyaloperonospora arabidopsidis (strain Emoy2) TaxID=559515 RepID=M4BC87_HYAAE